MRRRTNWCGLCNCRFPAFFDVPDPVWGFYMPEEEREQFLCIECWHWLTDQTDASAFEKKNGEPLPLWCDAWRVRRGIPPDAPCPMTPVQLDNFTVEDFECRR
jgi:hypothetical protein